MQLHPTPLYTDYVGDSNHSDQRLVIEDGKEHPV